MAVTLLEIDGVDRRTLLRTGSFEINENINGRNTARFTIYSADGSYQPAFDDEVYIEIDGTNVFGGIVTERQIDYVAMGSATFTTVTCSDFSHYAERRLIKASTPGGISGRDAADYIVDNYLAEFGVTRDSGMAAGGTLGAVSYDYAKISDVFDDILRMVASNGWLWRINEAKVLEAFLPGAGSWVCPFSISSGGGLVVGDISLREVREEYANRVYVSYLDLSNVEQVSVAEDATEISAHGVYEYSQKHKGQMDTATADAMASGLLAQLAIVPTEITFTTQAPGARAGQTITVNVAARVLNDDFLIQSLRAWDVGGHIFYRITAISDGAPVIKPRWKETYKLWAGQGVSVGGGSGRGVTSAASRVQNTGIFRTTSALSISGSFGSLPGIGSLIIVGVHGTGLANWTGGDVTDNQGHTYTRAVTVGATNDAAIFYTIVTASSGTFTVTVNPANLGATALVASAVEYAGNWSASTVLDRTASNTGSGTAVTSGTTSQTQTPIEVVAAIFVAATNQATIAADTVSPAWVQEHEELGAGGYIPGEFVTRTVEVIATQAAGWTLSTSTGSWAACIATFREA